MRPLFKLMLQTHPGRKGLESTHEPLIIKAAENLKYGFEYGAKAVACQAQQTVS